jgi:hypothetical protein
MSIKILLAGVVLSAGCYKAIGVKAIPTPTAPTLVDGEQAMASDDVIELNALKINAAGDLVHKKKRVGVASYNGEKLSIPRLEALAHPDQWKQAVTHAQELRSTCRGGVVPEVLATGFMIVATALAIGLTSEHGSGGNYSSNAKLVLYGAGAGVAAAGVSYGVGWFSGGSACVELEGFRRSIYLDETDDMVNQSWDDVELINKLASEFNTAHPGGHAAPAEPAPDEQSSN